MLCYSNNLVSLTRKSKPDSPNAFVDACQPPGLRLRLSKPSADSSKTTTIIVIQLKFSFNSATLAFHLGARHAPCVTDTHWPYFDQRLPITQYAACNAAQHAEPVIIQFAQHAQPVITQFTEHAKPVIIQLAQHAKPAIIQRAQHAEPAIHQ